MEFIFRMQQRHRMRVDLWQVDRSATHAPTKDIVFGDITLLPTDQVASQFFWRQSDFTYTYSVLTHPRFELGVGVGMHLIEAKRERPVWARGLHESFNGAGPFGTVALDGTFLITDRFSFNARAQYMSLTLSITRASSAIITPTFSFAGSPTWPSVSATRAPASRST